MPPAQILQAANAWQDQPTPEEEVRHQQDLADWAEKHYLAMQRRKSASGGAASGSSPLPPGRRRGRPGQRPPAGANLDP